MYRGARVGGLKQLQQVDRELGLVHFLNDYPDAVSGQQWAEENRKVDLETYDKKPPAKRVNYEKLGTKDHAFSVPWLDLIRSFTDNDRFYVLRSREVLKGLQRALVEGNIELLPQVTIDIKSALIPVCVTAAPKGVPSSKAAICIPTSEDLDSLRADPKFGGPSEPIHKVDSKKQKTDTSSNRGNDSRGAVKLTRTVIGYVSEGDMSLSIGKGRGLGFVTFDGLKQLLSAQQEKGTKVLVRGITEMLYRFHTLEVIC